MQQWHHLAAVYDAGANTLSFYVDQVLQGTANPSWNTADQNDWWIGDWPAIATRAMAGWLDAVSISDEVLPPENFVLMNYGLTGSEHWEEYR